MAAAASVSTFARYFEKNKEKAERMIEELGEALRRDKLAAYLKTIQDPDRFALDLAGQLDEGSLFTAILKVCDAKIAVPLLSCVTTPRLLNSAVTVKRAVAALKVFDQREWLPVFIQVLKTNRTRHWNRINIADLLQRDGDPASLFHKKLPRHVREALQVEVQNSPIGDRLLSDLFRSVTDPRWYLKLRSVGPY